ncbi:MAG: hypothetical protein GX654_00410 [Desulfatiglans sp.]|jgi:hypothetical protein|nr:hypothetical protein [Desulfatiglans sp.]
MIKLIIFGIISILFITPINAKDCSRGDLKKYANLYFNAQKAGEPSLLPINNSTVFNQNKQEISSTESILNTALPISFQRNFYDTETCTVFAEVIVDDDINPYVIDIKIQVKDDMVTKIAAIVTTDGDWEFDAKGFLEAAKKEDWSEHNPNRIGRDGLIKAADAYFDYFTYEKIDVPWGNPCAHLEGGKKYSGNDTNPSCKAVLANYALDNVEREYFVDEKSGVVNVFCYFGKTDSSAQYGAYHGNPDSHTFYIVNGKLRYIHSLTVIEQARQEEIIRMMNAEE